jgi:gliding motility-associated-like protein
VDLGNDTSLCGDESLILDGGTDGQFFNWSTGEISQQITVYQAGRQEIWVVVEDAFGCVNSDTMLIEECDIEFYFRDMPTAITTNDDGVNDVWNIEKLSGYSQAVMEIFDQWGTLVWRSEPGYPEPWDGRNMNGKLVPVDSYHFVIEFHDGTSDPLVGIVTVIH